MRGKENATLDSILSWSVSPSASACGLNQKIAKDGQPHYLMLTLRVNIKRRNERDIKRPQKLGDLPVSKRIAREAQTHELTGRVGKDASNHDCSLWAHVREGEIEVRERRGGQHESTLTKITVKINIAIIYIYKRKKGIKVN